MRIKPLLYGAGAFALVYGAGVLYRQSVLIQNSDFELGNVKILGLDRSGLNLSMDLKMNNKSNLTITTYKQVYDIYLNDIFVGKILDNKTTVIPKKGVGTFNYRVVVNPALIIKSGINILGAGDMNKMLETTIIRIKGTMSARTSGIFLSRLPIDMKFKLGDYLK